MKESINKIIIIKVTLVLQRILVNEPFYFAKKEATSDELVASFLFDS